MTKKELFKRYTLFIISLLFIGVGIALAKRAELGISPISSVPNVFSIRFDFISFGSWLFVFNMLMLLTQIVILRKRFPLIQLLQIPLSLIYGYFADLAMIPIMHIPNDHIAMRGGMVMVSVVVLGFGISLGVIANVLLNSPEALIKTISDETEKNFGNVKVTFDVCWVAFAALMGSILGINVFEAIGVGTLFIALTVGFIVKFFKKLLDRPITKLLTGEKK